ncbi:hypothetical protein A2U01_0082431, partial [Trifolium medium]|nr:hypothetical protein [Trifolium medium]
MFNIVPVATSRRATNSDTRSVSWPQLATPATTSDSLASTSPVPRLATLKNGDWRHKNLAWRQHAEQGA